MTPTHPPAGTKNNRQASKPPVGPVTRATAASLKETVDRIDMAPRTRKLSVREEFLAKRISLSCKKCQLVGGYRLNGTAGGRAIVSCISCSHRNTGQQIEEVLAKVDLPAGAIDDGAEAERTEDEEEGEGERRP